MIPTVCTPFIPNPEADFHPDVRWIRVNEEDPDNPYSYRHTQQCRACKREFVHSFPYHLSPLPEINS